MSTRIWSFLPLDMRFVPTQDRIENAIAWLRLAMPAYKVEAIDHGKIAFFDSGGNMGATYCPQCHTEQSAGDWSEWMTEDYDDEAGFEFSPRVMPCCGQLATLDRIIFENSCFFGRFGIAVTDTMQTYPESEIEAFATQLGTHLGCAIRFLESHY